MSWEAADNITDYGHDLLRQMWTPGMFSTLELQFLFQNHASSIPWGFQQPLWPSDGVTGLKLAQAGYKINATETFWCLLTPNISQAFSATTSQHDTPIDVKANSVVSFTHASHLLLLLRVRCVQSSKVPLQHQQQALPPLPCISLGLEWPELSAKKLFCNATQAKTSWGSSTSALRGDAFCSWELIQAT